MTPSLTGVMWPGFDSQRPLHDALSSFNVLFELSQISIQRLFLKSLFFVKCVLTDSLKIFQVVSISTKDNSVTLDNGAQVKFDKCLIATGGQPKNLLVFENFNDKTTLFRKV